MAKKQATQQRFLVVGQIVAPHGIRGEVKVEVMSDYPERFKAGVTLYLSSNPEGTDARPVTVVTSRPHHDRVLIRLTSTADRNTAEQLRSQYLLIPETEAMALGEHENFVHDLIGLQVATTDGEALGEIAEVVFTPANDVYVVRGAGGEVLLPAIREVVQSVDLAARTMTVSLLEGLRDAAEVDAEDNTDDADATEGVESSEHSDEPA